MVIAQNHRAPLVFGRPRHSPVHQRLDEKDRIARFGRDLRDAILVRLVQPDLVRAGIVGLMAAGQASKTPILRPHIRQLYGDIGHPAKHPAIAVEKPPRAIKRLTALVKPEAFGPLVHSNNPQALQTKTRSQQFFQIRLEPRMGDHRPKRIAMRFVPRQHPTQIAASLRALERLRLVGQVIGADADLIGVVVNRRIGRRHFRRRESALDH